MNEKMIEKDNETYRKIDDIGDYIRETAEVNACMGAKKNGYITVRRAEPDEKIAVFTSDGHEEAQETAKEGDWIATRVYENEIPYINENGSHNTWLMSGETLEKKYDAELDDDGRALHSSTGEIICRPKGKEQTFMRVSENVVLSVPWGENGAPVDQYVKEGGWLNITDRNDVYGIAEQEFFDTYDRTTFYNGPGGVSRITSYDRRVNETICRDTWEKALERIRSTGVEFSDPEYKQRRAFGDGSVKLSNGIRMHVKCGLSVSDEQICAFEKSGQWVETDYMPITEANIHQIESLKAPSYEAYLENTADRYFPEQKDEIMSMARESGLTEIMKNSAEPVVFYQNEPDFEAASLVVDNAKELSAYLEAAKEADARIEALKDMPHSNQEERVALLKNVADIYKCVDGHPSPELCFDNEAIEETEMEGMSAGLYETKMAVFHERPESRFDLDRDAMHEVTNKVINEFFEQLSADTQGVTHDEVQKDFNKYAVPGLDSIQYITDNENHHYDLVQLTLSDDKYFNADVIRIPSELVDNLPSAMAAAAKYSQTQEEFEKECPDISYEETYHDADETEYSECSAAFKPLGDARTDDEIGEVMYAAAGNIEKDSYEYEAYMHAVEVLDDAGIEGLKEEVEERYMSDQEWEENERDERNVPEYDDFEL